MAEWVGKLRASVLRIAALLHVARGEDGFDISVQDMESAIRIGDYYLAHAKAIFERWGTNGCIAAAQQILDGLSRTGRSEFSIRDLQRAHRRLFATVEDIRAPLELLVERGWIRPTVDGPIVTGRRGVPSATFTAHPTVHAPRTTSKLSPMSPMSQGVADPPDPEVSSMSPKTQRTVMGSHPHTHNSLDTEPAPQDMGDMDDNPNGEGHWSGLL